MKTQTLPIGHKILIAILLTIPLTLAAESPELSNMEMSLFMSEVEDEMIRSSHWEATNAELLNFALRRLNSKSVVTEQPAAVSNGAINLMIIEIEEEMVKSAHQEMTSEELLSSALYSLVQSVNDAKMRYSEIPPHIHFTIEMNLFLHKVEDEMLREEHQRNASSSPLNNALREMTVEIKTISDESTSLSGSFKEHIPSREDIDRFINEVESDAAYFNTTITN